MKNLFKGPSELPSIPSKIPIFLAFGFDSIANSNEAYHVSFDKRVQRITYLFGVKGKPVNEGERLVFRDGSCSLQIYWASDSMWWANHELAYRDSVDGKVVLPTEDEARRVAARELDRVEIDVKEAHFSSVSFVEISTVEKDRKPRRAKTAIEVNYGFSIEELPVFGPGAKIKVSLADGGRLAQLIFFWRHPKRARKVPTISPEEALKRFREEMKPLGNPVPNNMF